MSLSFWFSLVFLSLQSFASPYFDHLRDDQSVPEACEQMSLSFYEFPAEYFYVGRLGGLDMGYTFEYPLERQDATTLWQYFRSVVAGTPDANLYHQIRNDAELYRDYLIIDSEYEYMDFDFGNEGEILEILAIHQLYQEFPENTYFITGAVEYHRSDDLRTIGELDVFVGRRDTCSAVAVGETKLGKISALRKAKRQLKRFEGFLKDHDASEFSGEYVPRRGIETSVPKCGTKK